MGNVEENPLRLSHGDFLHPYLSHSSWRNHSFRRRSICAGSTDVPLSDEGPRAGPAAGRPARPGKSRGNLFLGHGAHHGNRANFGGAAPARGEDLSGFAGNFPRPLGGDDAPRSGKAISRGSGGMGKGSLHLCADRRRKRPRRDGAGFADLDSHCAGMPRLQCHHRFHTRPRFACC